MFGLNLKILIIQLFTAVNKVWDGSAYIFFCVQWAFLIQLVLIFFERIWSNVEMFNLKVNMTTIPPNHSITYIGEALYHGLMKFRKYTSYVYKNIIRYEVVYKIWTIHILEKTFRSHVQPNLMYNNLVNQRQSLNFHFMLLEIIHFQN